MKTATIGALLNRILCVLPIALLANSLSAAEFVPEAEMTIISKAYEILGVAQKMKGVKPLGDEARHLFPIGSSKNKVMSRMNDGMMAYKCAPDERVSIRKTTDQLQFSIERIIHMEDFFKIQRLTVVFDLDENESVRDVGVILAWDPWEGPSRFVEKEKLEKS